MTDVNATLRIRPAGAGAMKGWAPTPRAGQVLAGRRLLDGGLEIALAGDAVLAAVHAPFALAGFSLGLLLGALLVGRLHGKMTPGRLPVAVCVGVAVAVALLAAPLGPWSVFGCLLLSTLTVPALRILIGRGMLRLGGPERRVPTTAAARSVLSVGPPLGALAAAVLLQFAAGALADVLALAAIQVCLTLGGADDRRSSRLSAQGA